MTYLVAPLFLLQNFSMNIYPLSVDEQNIELEIALIESEVNNAIICQSKSFFESYVWQLYAESNVKSNATSTVSNNGDIW